LNHDDIFIAVIARPKAVAISSEGAEELKITTAAAPPQGDGSCHLTRLSIKRL